MSEKEKLSLSYFGSSDTGLVRKDNQDSYGKFPPAESDLYSGKGVLFIVADGMGGHLGGKEASSIAVKVISDVFNNSNSSDILAVLKQAAEKANSEIFSRSISSEDLRGMGTTCTALVLKDDKGFIAHIGDSRIYIFDLLKNQIEQLTEDHTKVNEMIKEGILTEKEAELYPSKSVLMRALGVEEFANIDFKKIMIKKGQTLILCSDGLGSVSKDEIKKIVTENSPEQSCKNLIELANNRGGKDNVTIQVIKIGSEISGTAYPSKVYKKKKVFPVILIIFLILVIAAVFYFRNFLWGLIISEKGNDPKEKAPEAGLANEVKNPDSFSNLQMQADHLFQAGNFEKSLSLYKQILNSEPMNIAALQGINNIASEYFTKAEKFKTENKRLNALELYKKVLEIQPENSRVKEIIQKLANQSGYRTEK